MITLTRKEGTLVGIMAAGRADELLHLIEMATAPDFEDYSELFRELYVKLEGSRFVRKVVDHTILSVPPAMYIVVDWKALHEALQSGEVETGRSV